MIDEISYKLVTRIETYC